MRRPALVILVLAAAASFFGWETYNAWTASEGPADLPAAGIAPAARPDAAADYMSRDGDLPVHVAVIVNKPLFRPDRQPFHENAAVSAQRNYQAELARFSLVGILLQGEVRKGLVVSTGAGRQDRWEVGSGDSIPGFAVKEVQTDGLALAADGKEFLLPLYAGGPKGQPAGSLRTEIVPGIPAQPASSPRREIAPGIPAPQVQGIPKAASSPPNVNIPAARPPAPAVVQPPAPQPPVSTDGGRSGYPRPPRRSPLGQ